MFASASCSCILANASAFAVIAGHVSGWVLVASIVSLVVAAVLWVRHPIAPGERTQFSVGILLAAVSTGRQLRRNTRPVILNAAVARSPWWLVRRRRQ
ncbi:hypothetical protein ACR6C2_07085 [Streptomyces sp. INA 01156]